jgi:hypothetical protein
MLNPVALANSIVITATTTFGYGPGQTAPAELVIVQAGGAITINLPPINTVVPTPPTLLTSTVGVYGGARMRIFNQTGNAVTVAGQNSETIVGTISIGSANAVVTLQPVPGLAAWYKVA